MKTQRLRKTKKLSQVTFYVVEELGFKPRRPGLPLREAYRLPCSESSGGPAPDGAAGTEVAGLQELRWVPGCQDHPHTPTPRNPQVGPPGGRGKPRRDSSNSEFTS